LPHGKFVEYFGLERKSAEGEYRKGERIGEWNYWDKYGNPTLRMTFKDGKMVDKEVFETKKQNKRPETSGQGQMNKKSNKKKVNNSKRFK
jgi:antitoxin component YwqK of YwqJK toxin-antitoxin module